MHTMGGWAGFLPVMSGDNSHTGTYLADVVPNEMDKLADELAIKFCAIVTDSASNMIAMRDEICLKKPDLQNNICIRMYRT